MADKTKSRAIILTLLSLPTISAISASLAEHDEQLQFVAARLLSVLAAHDEARFVFSAVGHYVNIDIP